MKNILITGGAGFIGSHLVRHFLQRYPEYQIINLDSLSYAGNLENLTDVEDLENYKFIKGDIRDIKCLESIFDQFSVDSVIHCAAESHVDRSISAPLDFVQTNVIGTVNLLQVAKAYWDGNMHDKVFYHISTDEVFGSLPETGLFTEQTAYDPRSPYSASKASSDHFVRAYYETYKMPIKISNCSNNYGPNQFPEKLIPLMILNCYESKPLPIYGNGEQIRDWLYVTDHVEAIDTIFHQAKMGETYNVGGHNEWKNIDVVSKICDIMDDKLGRTKGTSRELITFVTDRAGHDVRYAIDSSKLQNELGWTPKYTFEQGIESTIDWYLQHKEWLQHVVNGSYQNYFLKKYNHKYT